MAQGVEGKVSDVGIFQQAVVVILEGFLLEVVTKFVGDDEALVGVLIPCPNLILRLLLFSAGKLVCYCAGQRNRAARVFRFGCAEYDFSFVFAVVGFVLGKHRHYRHTRAARGSGVRPRNMHVDDHMLC